ncbi:MAG: MFS transporter [Chloroflexi bacterium]|nr:MFS transporter [Chloroflexota bacterium]
MATTTFTRRTAVIPAEHRRNFFHLYMDIAWFGVLNASAISFMAVYATRLGATGWQIGLLSAAPAVVSLMVTLPMGSWLQKGGAISRKVFWTSVGYRLFYAVWVFLPFFLLPQAQVTALIVLVFLMSIPGTALSVGFNALFAAAVPVEWRSHVTGIRNALLAVTFIAVSLLCGWLLQVLPFPIGYQVVFAIGALGAAMSSVHLWYVRPLHEATYTPRHGESVGDLARPGAVRVWLGGMRTAVGDWRFLLNRHPDKGLQLRSVDQAFRLVLLAMFFFHLAQYLPISLLPLFWVNHLNLSDQDIGLGNAVFYGTVLLTSMQLSRLARRLSNRAMLVIGVLGMSMYPVLTAVTRDLTLFLIVSAVGGITWGLVSGSQANYLLERIPEDRRPAYLAWYNLALNAAVLLGSLGGPLLAARIGLVTTLFVSGAFRFLAALFVWRRG